MLQDFDIVVFGLESREDRWQRCLEIFEENNFKKVTRFATVKDERLVYRKVARDFIKLLKLKSKSEYLVFFEDDFELVTGWEKVFNKAWEEVPKDFDMLYLGANLTSRAERITDNLIRIRGAWTLHAVIFSNRFIEYVLKNYNPDSMNVFDDWCREIAPRKKFYMTYPMIAYQREGYSDFAKRVIYHDLYNNKFYRRV